MTRASVSFGEVAEDYHAIRPRYPKVLWDELVTMAKLPKGGRILEIGAGTGIATAEMINRGFHVTALEPSPEMAAVLRKNISSDQLAVVTGKWEEWSPEGNPFDLVIACTAFHWLDPATRFRRIYDVLTPDGCLAVIKYYHVAGGDRNFFTDTQDCYRQFMPGIPEFHPPEIRDFVSDTQTMAGGGLFPRVVARTYVKEESYSREEYERLLITYSDHRMLEDGVRSQLVESIGRLIDEKYGGRVRKVYLHELLLACRE